MAKFFPLTRLHFPTGLPAPQFHARGLGFWLWVFKFMAAERTTPSLHAQPVRVRQHFSFEWQVVNSDLVVLGPVVEIKEVKSDSDDYVVTLRVRETLLGKPREDVSFVIADETRESIGRWHGEMDEVLAVLVDTQKLNRKDDPPLPRDLQPQYLSRNRWCVFSMNPNSELQPVAAADLQLLRTPKEILGATRRAIAAKVPANAKPVAEAIRLKHPFGEAAPLVRKRPAHRIICSTYLIDEDGKERLSDAGLTGYFYYWVPVDDTLESNAKKWVRSINHGFREQGAWALAYFKSPENIALLKTLLADPATEKTPEYPEGKLRLYASSAEFVGGFGFG